MQIYSDSLHLADHGRGFLTAEQTLRNAIAKGDTQLNGKNAITVNEINVYANLIKGDFELSREKFNNGEIGIDFYFGQLQLLAAMAQSSAKFREKMDIKSITEEYTRIKSILDDPQVDVAKIFSDPDKIKKGLAQNPVMQNHELRKSRINACYTQQPTGQIIKAGVGKVVTEPSKTVHKDDLVKSALNQAFAVIDKLLKGVK